MGKMSEIVDGGLPEIASRMFDGDLGRLREYLLGLKARYSVRGDMWAKRNILAIEADLKELDEMEAGISH